MVGTSMGRTRAGAGWRRAVATGVLAAGLAACHAQTAASARAPSAVGADDGAAIAPAPDTWVTAFVPTGYGYYVSAAETDGTRSVASGSSRWLVHRETTEGAPDLLASPVVSAAQLKGSWYFVTATGDILRAATFLGRPADAGAAIGAGASGVAVGHDLALFTDWEQGLWSFDGSKATRLKLPVAVAQVTSLASDQNGLPRVEISPCEGLLSVDWYAVDATGSFTPVEKPAAPIGQYGHGDLGEKGVRVLDEKLRVAQTPREVTSSKALAALNDLIALLGGSFGRGAELFPKEGIDHCTPMQAGEEPLAYCEGTYEGASNGIFRLHGGRFERWVDVRGRQTPGIGPGPSLLMRNHEGELWLRPGTREIFSERELGASICEVPDVQHESTILGLVGPVVLMSRVCGDQESFEVIDLSTRSDMQLATLDPLEKYVPPGATILDALLSADQTTLAVLVRSAPAQIAVAIGPLGGRLRMHLLPPQVKGIAFADARRGMAIGTRLDQVWITRDGGAHWTRPTLPIAGDPAVVPLTAPPTCTTFMCASDTTLAWADPRALAAVGYQQVPVVAPAHSRASPAAGELKPRRAERPRDRDARKRPFQCRDARGY